MILMGKDELVTKKALFFASKELSRIGLNINSGKVILFDSKDKFNQYWAFDIFDKLGDKEDKKKIESAIDDYKKYLENKTEFRKDSVLNRILNCNLKVVDICKKQIILAEVLKDAFLINCEEWQLKKIYGILGDEDKKSLKEKLEKLTNSVYFNKFHYVLLKLKDLFGFNENQLKQKIDELKF